MLLSYMYDASYVIPNGTRWEPLLTVPSSS